MEEMDSLLTRLSNSGVEFNLLIREALMSLDIRNFTSMNPSSFYQDRPLIFLENERGGVKTISAPHMILTLLHHLELREGMDVVVIGSKGGYISALINEIVGNQGSVTLLDYDSEVLKHAAESHKLSGCYDSIIRKKLRRDGRKPVRMSSKITRVLITGSVELLPKWIDSSISEGGFTIFPHGDRINQKLIKRERQGRKFLDTNLGDVVFGPLDIKDSEPIPPSPFELADILEEVSIIAEDFDLIDIVVLKKLENLIKELRLMYEDENEFENFDSEEMSIRVIELLTSSESWMCKLWPILMLIAEIDSYTIGEFYCNENYFNNGHEDLIP